MRTQPFEFGVHLGEFVKQAIDPREIINQYDANRLTGQLQENQRYVAGHQVSGPGAKPLTATQQADVDDANALSNSFNNMNAGAGGMGRAGMTGQNAAPAPDPMAAVNAERVRQAKAMRDKVQAASGTPNPVGDGVHRYSGHVMPGGQVQNAQYSHTPAPAPQSAGPNAALGKLIDPAAYQARLDAGDRGMRGLGYGGNNSNSPAPATPAGGDDSLILPSQAPQQPRPMVPNITRPPQRPSFTPNAGAAPAPASAPASAPAPTPAPTPAPAPAPVAQLNPRDIQRQEFQARTAVGAQAQANARAAAAANGGRPVPGSGRLSRGQQMNSPAAGVSAPSSPASSWAQQTGAAAAAAAAGGIPAAAGAVTGRMRANGTPQPQFGNRTPRQVAQPNPTQRYGESPLVAKARYRAANSRSGSPAATSPPVAPPPTPAQTTGAPPFQSQF